MADTDYLIIGLINHNMDNTTYVIYYARISKKKKKHFNAAIKPINVPFYYQDL